MKIINSILVAMMLAFFMYASAFAVPPIPARIGGTVTIDGTLLTESNDEGYVFKVTKTNGDPFDPVAEDDNGLNAVDWYIIDIPIHEATEQPGGAQPDEKVTIHVYINGVELKVTSPVNGEIEVGESGSTFQIDIVAQPMKCEITVYDSVLPFDDKDVPFGSVDINISSEQTVTIKNEGNADCTVESIAQNDALAIPFSISNDDCSGKTLIPSASCTLIVNCIPTAVQTFNDSFDIESNDDDTVTVRCTGAIEPPDISVTDSIEPVDDHKMLFGNLTEGLSLERAVKITNKGFGDLDVGVIAQHDPLASPFSISDDNCSGMILETDESCSIKINFSPSMGSFNDTVDIPNNDPDTGSVELELTGEGLSSANNNAPSIPELLYPTDGQQGLGSSLTFKWKKSSDPDQNTISYKLYYSEDQDFIGTTPSQIASIGKLKYYYAWNSIGLLFGIAFIGGIVSRKKIVMVLIVIIATYLVMVACNGDPAPPPPSTDISKNVSGLNSGTKYYWKVIADDGNGGRVESDVQTFITQ